MKSRIVKGRNFNTYEVEVKKGWLLPWEPVYVNNGLPFPWRGSYDNAVKIKNKLDRL
jgi:hypothetical protein